jgi:flavodoxin-like protein
VHRRLMSRTLALPIAMMLALGCVQLASAQTVSVLVALHSATGNTEKMAQGVADGVKTISGANVVVKRVGEVTADDLLSSDGVVIGSPVYFGNMSGEVKQLVQDGPVPRSENAEQGGRNICDGCVLFERERTHNAEHSGRNGHAPDARDERGWRFRRERHDWT